MSNRAGIHFDVVLRRDNPAPRSSDEAITVFITVAGIRDALTFEVSGSGGTVYVTLAISSGRVLHVTPNPYAVEHGLLDKYVQIALAHYRARWQLDIPVEQAWLRWVNQPPAPYQEQLAALGAATTTPATKRAVDGARCRYNAQWDTERICGYHGAESECRAATCTHFEIDDELGD